MPIETDEDAFTAICALLGITSITQLVGVSDNMITSRCENAELADMLIELKRETLRQVIRHLADKHRAGPGKSQSDLMFRLHDLSNI